MDMILLDTLFFVFLHLICTTTSELVSTSYYNFTSVYSNSDEWNWFEAKDYCMNNFGSSLASIHSLIDEFNMWSSRYNNNSAAWIGLNDLQSQSTPFDQSLNNSFEWSVFLYHFSFSYLVHFYL